MDSQGYSETCVFCRLAKGLVRGEIVFQDDQVMAFKDIHPQTPVHMLVIPKQHITALWEADESHAGLMGRLLLACNEAAQMAGIDSSGYRVVINSGEDAGQSVDHLHLHVMGGRKLKWPPG
ncbi:MAG TPA: histidine triad nucleotide-binding protein [Chloroflexia bacterium]|nr:histidine triad nucleotide-binding protein [Chloroflexia bacterium]